MAYAAYSDIEAAIGSAQALAVFDFDGDGDLLGAEDVAAIAGALNYGASVIDSFCGSYLPITTVTPALIDANVQLAIHRARVVREMTTEDSRLGYEQVMSWLKMVANGTVILVSPTDDDTATPPATRWGIATGSEPRSW